MTPIDGTGLHPLEDLAQRLQESGRALILCGMREQPAQLMHKAEFQEHVGAKNLCPSVTTALTRAAELDAARAAEASVGAGGGR